MPTPPLPIEGEELKRFRLWQVTSSGKRIKLLGHADTKAELQKFWPRRIDILVKLYDLDNPLTSPPRRGPPSH